uniref:TLDc domain-containing protein n=1 Tax=Guillardia theta TaxID=55529 RepID=A0A7S4LZZ8_GUITH|mmetsp:Transcript_1081/g.3362  ORF Transcript_1081/g.3362 Transcript_1081/m.3362 type:complete len:788 (+) Transcript_1081:74-2437(+)
MELFKAIQEAFWASSSAVSVEVGPSLLEVIVEAEKQKDASKYLLENYKGKFMVWSLLPVQDTEDFDNDVQDIAAYVTSPPALEDILKVCHSIHGWIECDTGNVAVVLSSSEQLVSSWSALICCAYSLYSKSFVHAAEAFAHLACQRIEATLSAQDILSNPESAEFKYEDLPLVHRTYLFYVETLIKTRCIPHDSPIYVTRIVMHGIPKIARQGEVGCIPVISMHSVTSGRMIFSSEWQSTSKSLSSSLRVYSVEDCSAIFPVNAAVMGDVVLRMSHRESLEEEESKYEKLFEFSFHSAMLHYHQHKSTSNPQETITSAGLIRLDRSSLGIRKDDKRFDEDFSIDILIASDESCLTDDLECNVQSKESNKTSAPRYDTLQRLLDALPPADEHQHVKPQPRPTLKVTPNPREILEEFFSDEVDSSVTSNINSVPIIFSFPPFGSSEEQEDAPTLLHEGDSQQEELLLDLGGAMTGRPVRGFCMVLPSLVVLEPLRVDKNARMVGIEKCQIRIPVEKIVKFEVTMRAGHPPASSELDQQIVIEWDGGSSIEFRRVVLIDQPQLEHVPAISKEIKGAMEALEKLQSNIASGSQTFSSILKHSEEMPKLMRHNEEGFTMEAASMIASEAEIIALRTSIPIRFRIIDTWELLYSTTLHGISLETFFRRTGWRAPTLLLLRDSKRAVFGAFCSAPWEAHSTFFGTGESFVFRTVENGKGDKSVRVFRWSGKNSYFQLARRGEGIAIGAGKNNAIRLDPDFLHGSSGLCETFDSPGLASSNQFECVFLEVWGFSD